MAIVQTPDNILRFVLKIDDFRFLGRDDYLAAVEAGGIGEVDSPLLTEDEWSEGKLLAQAEQTPEVKWLREMGITFKLERIPKIQLIPITIQLFNANEAMRFKLQFAGL